MECVPPSDNLGTPFDGSRWVGPARVQDIDFGYRQITVREGKGNKDRITVLPAAVEPRLQLHIEDVRVQFEKDLKEGGGYVRLPKALGRKYPDADRAWGWQWVFPAHRQYEDSKTGPRRRHHLDETVLMIYTHVLNRGGRCVRSPMDVLR